MALSKPAPTNPILAYINKIGNPDVFGPGEWWRLHEDAYWARTKDEIDHFIRTLPRRFKGLPCQKCRENALTYLAENNPERYRHLKEGMFRWTYDFHNYKNKELNKLEIPYDKAIAAHRSLEFPEDIKSEACDFCVEKGVENTKPRSPRVQFIK